jgi:hypothetical protein
MTIRALPKSFDLVAMSGRWFRWNDVEKCFWPGRGKRPSDVDSILAEACATGGVYVLAWSSRPMKRVSHVVPEAIYIGETVNFRGRMVGWARSAGFWGERSNGHSAAWRWKKGSKSLWLAFFPTPDELPRRLAKHVRCYYEVMAIEEYRVKNGSLPAANEWEQISGDRNE